MKKLVICIIVVIATLMACSCTENSRAKTFGGTADLNVPCNQRVTNIT